MCGPGNPGDYQYSHEEEEKRKYLRTIFAIGKLLKDNPQVTIEEIKIYIEKHPRTYMPYEIAITRARILLEADANIIDERSLLQLLLRIRNNLLS